MQKHSRISSTSNALNVCNLCTLMGRLYNTVTVKPQLSRRMLWNISPLREAIFYDRPPAAADFIVQSTTIAFNIDPSIFVKAYIGFISKMFVRFL